MELQVSLRTEMQVVVCLMSNTTREKERRQGLKCPGQWQRGDTLQQCPCSVSTNPAGSVCHANPRASTFPNPDR